MLNDTQMQDVLLAVLSHSPEAAEQVLASADLTDEERASLGRALLESTPAGAAQALGDLLHLMSADRDLVNECYRAAFYADSASAEMVGNPLFAYFTSRRTGRPIDKWVHYFPVYHQVLAQFRGRQVKVLEIGTYHGGGLDMISHYLGPEAEVVGMYIAMGSERVGAPNTVIVGDQSDPDFLFRMSEAFGPFDIVIDDGGHSMKQQIVSAETLFPLINDGGVYIVEDCHTSYWEAFQDSDQTFLDWVRDRIDDINTVHIEGREFTVWSDHLDSLSVHDSLVVMHKKHRFRPFCEVVGTNEFVLRDRKQATALISLRAIRDETNRGLAEDLTEVREELAASRDETAQLRRELENTQEELTLVRASRSWRVTSGLRKLRGTE